ncbi:MAG: InlB B-repeat-containing protein, partial [Akkermansiaceae bacterium]
PLTITMSDNQSVGVRFDQDGRDPDQDGLSNYEELLLYETDPNDPDSDDDGFNDGLEQSEGTNPRSSASYPTRTLTLVSADNGSVFGAGVYRLNEVATVVASPNRGYVLSGWSDGASGTENPLTVTMTQNTTIGVTFDRDGRDPDSDSLTNYEELIVHRTNPDDSDTDSDGFSDGLEVTEGSNPLDRDSFPTRSLTTLAPSIGTISGADTYPLGSEVTILATADRGYVFSSWTGGLTGDVNPLTQTLSENLTVGAVFERDVRDSDQDGISNYDELIVYDTDPLNPDSDGDGFNDGFEVANNTDLNGPSSTPPMDLELRVSKTDSLLFGVLTITPPVGGIIAIEETRDLKTWTQIDSFAGTGATFTRTVLPSGPGVYYRLRLIDQSQ